MRSVMLPVKLKNISFKNRIVRSATNTAMGNEDGSFSDNELKMYQELSSNQIGLIITGHCYVNPQGQTKAQQTSMCNPAHLGRLREVVELVHNNGSKIFAQLSHGGANVVVPEYPVAPTGCWTPYGKRAKMLTVDEIHNLVEDFVKAAKLAKESGFDGVQVHAAHGFLLCEFLSYGMNLRKDLYGGSALNRIRIVCEIIKAIKRECGENYPVFVKINSNCAMQNEDYKKDMYVFFEQLQKAGTDAIELSGYDFAARNEKDRCFYLRDAAMLRQKFDIPVILVGGIRNLENMEAVLEAGIDMVSMGRPFIAEPDLITRLLNGQKESKCIGCSRCFGLYLKSRRRCILNKPGSV